MREMEEGTRSGELSGGLVKKKSSSGCLIIKKKGDGMGGVGSSGSTKVYQSKKARKRARLVLSDSGSTEPLQRKVVSKADKFRNGSVVYKKGIVEDSDIVRNGEIESERKRSRLDVFEFDEYDVIDGKKMRKDYMDDRLKLAGRSGNQREFETGTSRHVMVDKRKHSYFDGTSSSLSGRNKGPSFTVKNRFDMEEDEAHVPITFLREKFREPPDEPIRLQGKNGVLKVMVNKKKKVALSHKTYDDNQEAEDRKGSRSEDAVKKKITVRPSFYSDSKRPEKPVSYVKTEKSELKLRKSLSTKSSMADESETEDSDTSLKLGSTTVQPRSSSKGMKNEGKSTPSAEKFTSSRGKEGKVKCGSGTEKQLLREKIKNMLVSAGWTIDYRPRRGRDYLDAVYINPMGTAYWSIIKAYDALQKQLEEEDVNIKPGGDSSPFAPLSEETLSKLTRQTRKKIEKEMKKKRREDGRRKNVKEAAEEEYAEGTDSDKHEEKLSFFMKQKGKSLKGRFHQENYLSGDDSSGNLHKGMPKKDRAGKLSTSTNSDMIQGRNSRKIGRCTLLVRSSDKGLNSESDGFVSYTGKRTLLSWLIDSGTVHLSEKVQYMKRRRDRVMQEGWITRDGIHCGCCSKILTVSKFEIHAGTKVRQPFQNIFLESGVSLLQCQIDAWNKQEESARCGFHTVDIDGDDPNDDTCGLCGDGGDLICCDGCPSTFHQSCLDIKMLPPGDWHCPNCTCKFCGIAIGNIAQENDTAVGALLTCSTCDKKYHEPCSQEIDAQLAKSSSASTSFCRWKCREVFDHSQKLLGVKHELEAGFSWSLIHRTDLDSDTSHRGFPQRVECNSKLAVALSVMDECFLPIFDRRSGINLIHNVLYNCGSNFSRLNYSGFYTAILERGDEIISAASIRIHGTQLAEMPFIGTRHIYRRQGMCRRLLCAIESALCSLKVEKLIIPAIAEHMHTWTTVFGFNPLEESHKQEMRSMNMLVFPGTDMLQKLLREQEITEGNIIANSGEKSTEIRDKHCVISDLAKKCDMDFSAGHDLHMSDGSEDAGVHHANEMSEKVTSTDSDSQAPAVPPNDIAGLNSCLDSPEPKIQVSREETISFNSASVNKLAESAADLKRASSSEASHVILEMENPLLDPPVKGDIQSSAEGGVDDSHGVNVKVACVEPGLDSVNETFAKNTAEEVNENHSHPVYVSSVHVIDKSSMQKTTMQFNSNLNYQSAVDMESKLHVAPDIASNSEVAPVEDNIQCTAESLEDDAHEVNVEVACAEPVINSLGSRNPVSLSSCGTDEHIVPFNSDLNQLSAFEMERKLHVASEVSDAEVDPDECNNIQIAAVGDGGDADGVNTNFICVEPVHDSSGEISAQNPTEEISDNQICVSVSTHSGTHESTVQFNSDLNCKSTPEMESELHVALEIASEAEAAPVESKVQSSVVCGLDNTHGVNGKVACIEHVLDSVGEISSLNVAEEIIEEQNPVSVSTLCGSDKKNMQFNSVLNQRGSLEVESEFHRASEVASDVDLVESNIQFNAEGDTGDAREVNGKVSCVQPVLDSVVETSAQNMTQMESESHMDLEANFEA
uniref:PHD-type domain-containing protein n=1 Tax=Davidia involucrata TaxID=16924 RepID=A0A5B7BCG6_DAVIN